MSLRSLVLSLAGCLALTAIAALAFGWSFEKALYLSPVIVFAAGGIGFLVVLWSRVVWEQIRGPRRDA